MNCVIKWLRFLSNYWNLSRKWVCSFPQESLPCFETFAVAWFIIFVKMALILRRTWSKQFPQFDSVCDTYCPMLSSASRACIKMITRKQIIRLRQALWLYIAISGSIWKSWAVSGAHSRSMIETRTIAGEPAPRCLLWACKSLLRAERCSRSFLPKPYIKKSTKCQAQECEHRGTCGKERLLFADIVVRKAYTFQDVWIAQSLIRCWLFSKTPELCRAWEERPADQ